jgi:Na+/H+ antiporter NhaD/arsenite permease-like protein
MTVVLFALFVATLIGVALSHKHTLATSLVGLAAITAAKVLFTDFSLVHHLAHEWVTVANLFGLLLGFALLANHFELSHVPGLLPRFLPDDWKGPFVLLLMTAVLSSFLDNIAAAMIGGTVATAVFKGRVHVGYVAALIAASNAGGAGSVVGDTTTTMMWIDGVAPFDVLHAYVGAAAAILVFGPIASIQQDRYQRILADPVDRSPVEPGRLAVVALILGSAIAANLVSNVGFPGLADRFPVLAAAVWAAILVTAPFRRPDWSLIPEAARGAVFLLALVLCASMMPVSELPAASAPVALGIGLVSAVFDNIPLTALALRQGGYDWGFVAYAVGYGGSMIWFGSSAGVALTGRFAEARDTSAYLKGGWHVALGYVVGFVVLYLVMGWHPHPPHH